MCQAQHDADLDEAQLKRIALEMAVQVPDHRDAARRVLIHLQAIIEFLHTPGAFGAVPDRGDHAPRPASAGSAIALVREDRKDTH